MHACICSYTDVSNQLGNNAMQCKILIVMYCMERKSMGASSANNLSHAWQAKFAA